MYMGCDICSWGLTFRWVHAQNMSFKINTGVKENSQRKVTLHTLQGFTLGIK